MVADEGVGAEAVALLAEKCRPGASKMFCGLRSRWTMYLFRTRITKLSTPEASVLEVGAAVLTVLWYSATSAVHHVACRQRCKRAVPFVQKGDTVRHVR